MGGWTGKVLRVDLSTGVITKESMEKYKPYIGGTGLGYKVLWDEVPPGTNALDPANKVIFGVGPLTGTGAPLSGRVSVMSLSPVSPLDLPAAGHMGGHWGPELKYAGYDSLIVQGQAASPVWLYIKDDVVEIRDAGRMWGEGIYRATEEIMNIMGPEAHVAAIGQCGENLVRLSNVMCDRSHSAGVVGAVLGAKKLKAIGVLGTGALKIEATNSAWKDLVHYQHTLLGSNAGGVVPATFQAWQPDGYYGGGSRWTAANGVYWGAASPPVHTGECTAEDLNSIGLRTHKGYADFGAGVGDKHTVKIQGCHACPIRCHIATDVPALEQLGASRYQVNTCIGNSAASGFTTGIASRTENNITSSQFGVSLADDYGFWNDYGLVTGDFRWLALHALTAEECTAAGIDPVNAGKVPYEVRLTAAEYAKIPWAKFTGTDFTGKMDFMKAVMIQIKDNKMADGTLATFEKMQAGEPATLGAYIAVGAGRLEQLWPELAIQHQANTAPATNYIKLGHIKHHFTENGSMTQAAALINMMMNRDPQCHTHQNYYSNGLPIALRNEIFNELFGPFTGGDAEDLALVDGYPSPMNQAKAVFAKMSLLYLFLHNSLTLCNYTLPGWASPLKSRNYRGERNLEAMFYSAVTGHTVTAQQIEDIGLRILTLFRALTARVMESRNPGTGRDQRNNHDMMPEYAFHVHGTAGTLDPADWEVAKSMLYAELGWDEATGLPTQATYDRLGLGDVAAVMSAEGLMP
jgi:aldehyde:ferredoxin oxidoreductase